MAAARDETASPSLVEVEEEVRRFWRSSGLPKRLLGGTPDGPLFRFTEGPPTANGAPHIGHAIGRTVKDATLRYRRMTGQRIVSPMAGWDCHGLPVELEIERAHGFRSKKEIESYGVAKFCEECRTSVFAAVDLWHEMSERLGYWLDYDRPYLTMAPSYIESVWWSLRRLFDAGLLEKGHYCLPYCPRCETPEASHEVAQGYRETTDPSITLRLRVAGPSQPRRYLLVWTTTPWTLPANLLVAVHPDLTYVTVRNGEGEEYVLAESALPQYFAASAPVVERHPGRELVGLSYEPPFPFAGKGPGRYRVVAGEFVTAAEGTGIVHIAPSFGVDDQKVGEREKVGAFDPLDSRGVFTGEVPPVAGKWFKNADPILVGLLKEAGLLVREGTVRHVYPFCWRCGTPLIYRGVESWFVRTSRFSAELVANNRRVHWVPAHLRDGRFGNFLEEAKDWALSRNRYWGTPLPIWRCPKGHQYCVGSFEELARLTGSALPRDFDPHRVTVDAMGFPCPTCGGRMQREPYTIDGWYDSGCAPFAQYHYPFEPGPFDPAAPLDFVAEGLDQTRGWFYTLLVLATALFHRPAYSTCVSNGLALDESGQKMSKSKGNVLEPIALLRRLGGDAVRWQFCLTDFTEAMRVSEAGILKGAHRTLGTLLNVHAFYRANALADRLPPVAAPPSAGALLDRWILSRLEATRSSVERSLDSAEIRGGALAIQQFVDDLSSWYVRRSRDRFWSEEPGETKSRAHATLSFALLTLVRVLAPYAPFTSEWLYQQLTGAAFSDAARSVHGERFPSPTGQRDPALEEAMADVRAWVEIGREMRQRAQVKSRIPLPEFVLATEERPAFLDLGAEGVELLTSELNVRAFRHIRPSEAAAFREQDWVRRELPDGHVALLSRAPTEELRREGLLREALRRLQLARKEERLSYTEHVRFTIWTSGDVLAALKSEPERVAHELLAESLELATGEPPTTGVRRYEIDGVGLVARIERASPAPT